MIETLVFSEVDKVERRKRALTIEEASAVIESTEPGDMRDLLILVAATGQRWGDICNLKWSSVGDRIITLVPAKTKRRKGKEVPIPILPQPRTVLEGRKKTGTYVFPDLREEYERDSSAISKRIQKTLTDAGFTTHRENGNGRAIVEIGGHSLRHTFVTIARWAGLPDALIKEIMGHSSLGMTEHYTQFDKAMVSRLAASFQALPARNGKTLALPAKAEPAREQLPAWAVELVQGMTAKNWKTIRDELLEGITQ